MGVFEDWENWRDRNILSVLSKKYCRNCGGYKVKNRRILRECPECGDPEDKNFIHYLKEFLPI